MSEPQTVVAEVVTPVVALVPKDPHDMSTLVKETDKAVYNAMSGMESLDWKSLKPNQMAVLLMQKAFNGSGGSTIYLNFKQALIFAVRCFELGVSPLSDSVWYDANKGTVNLTLAGKREVARNRGIDLGPPAFTDVERDWASIPKMTETGEELRKSGFPKDVGIKCKIRVGDPKHQEYSEYTAWMSEWYQSRSPVWKSKPAHMLQTRATEKAITLALGTGASSMPDERELD